MVCACKNCKSRQVGCHATCDKYKEYRTNLDKQKIQERYQVNDVSNGWGFCRGRKKQ